MDSGVTSHICYNINYFDSLAPTSIRVAWGNGSTLPAQGIGSVTVKTPSSKAVLEQVLYIPEMHLNLVSLARLTKKGVTIDFAKDLAIMRLKSGA